jgi:predicted DNA-binding transcriptional regulator YafY
MKETGGTFRMPRGFDIEETFATSFGIYLPSGPGKTVKFRTSRTEAKFFRDLPVHKSQEEIASDDNSVTFSIFVCPDKNLIMEFCRYGSRIEVLSPAEVREEVARELSKAADIYK